MYAGFNMNGMWWKSVAKIPVLSMALKQIIKHDVVFLHQGGIVTTQMT